MAKGIECICIDDKNRPKEIPTEKWIVKGKQYTITHIFIHHNQGKIQGVELAELDISKCHPYVSFKMSRFAISVDDLGKLIELMKECSKLNDVEINAFIKNLIEEEELILEES